ncbi:hypothetical protein LshimejAT787_1301090 [Lyophyllum shimeji]|uniref:Uncharacterized protein n=1 Tax=Lyophyllum shimeji TaxID=47721 RepID=A0A9P3US16_LYOSH|nr:hypothetical protein LshimejAT787_1301090 [Lyophyllum shimeji]
MSVAIALILAGWSSSRAIKYLESRNLWTLCLQISIIQHWFVIPTILVVWALLVHTFVFQFPQSLSSFRPPIGLIFIAGALRSLLGYALPAYHSRGYLRLRWKAWSGPSRTGVRAELVQYIGDRRDWETLEASTQGRVTMHPVERASRLPLLSRGGLIASDTTDLLIARAAADQEENSIWIPRSDARQGVYQPVSPGEPASLLWGESLGFQRRCSRGIISFPKELLSPWPQLADGVDARGLCLACGILARNKGLRATSLICNLRTRNTFGVFEDNSIFWPRPAKTLRSLFNAECERMYSYLGPMFVTVATELALLLSDVPVEVAEDWLDAQLEHQDLQLNREAYALGANAQDLDLLYRGQYAAMLVSLSVHRVGVRIRPEMLVLDAVCKSEGVTPGEWAMSSDMQGRRQRELEALGQRVTNLVNAVV